MKHLDRLRVVLSAMIGLASIPSAWLFAGDNDDPVNVIFIFADDVGFGDLQCHRDDAFRHAPDQPNGRQRRSDQWRGKIRTPNLDRLAREGGDFHQFMVCSPVCAPSRVAAMTGQFPSRNAVHHIFTNPRDNAARHQPDWLPISAPFLPRLLHREGYKTGHFGKWHLGHEDGAPSPRERGIDTAAVYSGPPPHVFEGTSYRRLLEDSHGDEAASYLSIAATDHCLDFIEQHQSDPFYVNLWLHETHHVVTARPEDRVGYEDVPEPYQTYYGAVTRMDAQIGRVLERLDELKLSKRTLVIFSSDNGPENHTPRLQNSVGSPAGMRGRKRSLMMGGLNVPFLVRWPGVVPAGLVDTTTPLSAVDLLPTVLSAANVNNPHAKNMDGQDVLAALRGEPFVRTQSMFWFWLGNHAGDNWPVFGVRDNQDVMLVDRGNDRTELYDVVKDRFQTNDLSESRPNRVKTLAAQLDHWIGTLPPLPPSDIQTQIAGRRVKQPPSKSMSRSQTKPKTDGMSNEPSDAPDRRAIFDRKDRDGDGYLDLAEYSKNLRGDVPFQTRFDRFDQNGDGKIDVDEFAR